MVGGQEVGLGTSSHKRIMRRKGRKVMLLLLENEALIVVLLDNDAQKLLGDKF